MRLGRGHVHRGADRQALRRTCPRLRRRDGPRACHGPPRVHARGIREADLRAHPGLLAERRGLDAEGRVGRKQGAMGLANLVFNRQSHSRASFPM